MISDHVRTLVQAGTLCADSATGMGSEAEVMSLRASAYAELAKAAALSELARAVDNLRFFK